MEMGIDLDRNTCLMNCWICHDKTDRIVESSSSFYHWEFHHTFVDRKFSIFKFVSSSHHVSLKIYHQLSIIRIQSDFFNFPKKHENHISTIFHPKNQNKKHHPEKTSVITFCIIIFYHVFLCFSIWNNFSSFISDWIPEKNEKNLN